MMQRILLIVLGVCFSTPALAYDPNEPPLRTPEWYAYRTQQRELREQELTLYRQVHNQWRQDKTFRQEQSRVRDQERQRAFRFGRR